MQIPIEAARRVVDDYALDWVVIIGREKNRYETSTYGRQATDKDSAASFAKLVMRGMGGVVIEGTQIDNRATNMLDAVVGRMNNLDKQVTTVADKWESLRHWLRLVRGGEVK